VVSRYQLAARLAFGDRKVAYVGGHHPGRGVATLAEGRRTLTKLSSSFLGSDSCRRKRHQKTRPKPQTKKAEEPKRRWKRRQSPARKKLAAEAESRRESQKKKELANFELQPGRA